MSRTKWYLVFRITDDAQCNWDVPCGAVVNHEGNTNHAHYQATQRYHCAPYESLCVVEVFKVDERVTASCLNIEHQQMDEQFHAIMERVMG